jgi:hypothetical protein
MKIFELARWKRYLSIKTAEWLAYPEVLWLRLKAGRIFKKSLSRYSWLSENELKARKKSDTLFIFGCGYSLNSIPKSEWERISAHDTIGFNWFNHQSFVRCDFFFIREITSFVHEYRSPFGYIRKMKKYSNLFKKSVFKDTAFILQREWRAVSSKYFAGLGFLSDRAPVFPYKSVARGQLKEPTAAFSDGLVHGPCTLAELVNFATLMGYKKIVLTGVDLYDQRYFWLPQDKTRPELEERKIAATDVYPGIRWTVDYFKFIKPYLDRKGISVFVYNPKSLLGEIFPTFSWSAA